MKRFTLVVDKKRSKENGTIIFKLAEYLCKECHKPLQLLDTGFSSGSTMYCPNCEGDNNDKKS
jgi:transposase-like protein